MADIIEIIASPFGFIEPREPEEIAERIKEKLQEANSDSLVVDEEGQTVSE